MKRFIYLIIWLLLPIWALAQTNISGVEYWYDGDYGTAVEQTVTPGASVVYTDLLDVSSLEPGLHTFTARFQDTRGIWGSVLTQFFTYYPGSDIGIHLVTAAEYWYDGNYASAVETPLTPGASVDLNTLFDVSALIDGLHTVTVRFKDDRGIWSSPIIRFFKKEGTSGLKQLVAAEYWFNDDYANKHDSSFVATSSLDLTGMLDISTLRDGFNFVSLRVQDEAGKWGPVASWFFTKEDSESLPQLHQITALEYWYDGDYSSVQNDPVLATSLLALDTNLDVSALDDGLHIVSYRFRDEAGEWSSAYSRLFSKYPDEAAADMHELIAVDYWIDGDINSAVKSAVPAGSEYMLDTQLDLSALGDGLHFISYRFQDEAGVWSAAFSHLFSKYEDEILPADNKIVAYRYWANDQIGSATEITLSAPVQTLDINELIDVSSLPGGTNDISFQFIDSVGNWSSALTKSYTQDFNPRGTITAQTNPACTNNTATFTAETTDVDSIYWDFGDSTTIVGRAASEDAYHAYADAGDYTVSAILKQSSSGNIDTVYTSITVNQSYGLSVVAPENLIAFYPFDGNADDESGRGHNGTVYEAIPTADRNGNAGQAYYFDGTNDYIDLGDWENGGPMSFTFWARWDAFNNYSRIVDLGNGSSSNNIIVSNYQSGNTFLFSIYKNSSETQFRSTSVITSGQWDYFAVTVDNSGIMTIYKNGSQIDQKTNGVTPNKLLRSAQFIGKSNFSADGYFKGAIDEFKMYDKALSAEEIMIDYQGIGGTPLPPIVAEICASETPYTFGSQQLSTSGTYYESYPTVTGCDSIVQLNLTIHPTYNDTIGETSNTLVMDDFEDDVLGTLPDGWVIRYGGTGTANQIVVNNPVKNGAQSFQVSGSGWAANLSKAVASFPEKVTLEAWVRIENVLTGGACGLSLGNPSIATWGSFLGRVETESGNFITYNHSGSATTKYILQPAVSGSWTHIKIEYDYSSFKYKVFINGEQASGTNGSEVLTEFPLLETVLPTSVELYGNSMVYFDDVKLYESGNSAITICSADTPYTFGSQQLTTSGFYTETFQSEFGCDSTVTINLIVNPSYEFNNADTICENDLPYHWGDSTLNAPGTYTQVFTTVDGCDSIYNFTLTVNDTSLVEQEVTVCEIDLPYTLGTQPLTSGGIYTEVFSSKNGCDSTVVLSLIVKDTFIVADAMTVCETDLPVQFGGTSLAASGTYTEVFNAVNGCDSTVILTLLVNDTFNVADTLTVCEKNLPYEFGTQSLTGDGTFTEVFTSSAGCDSTVVLVFSVTDTSSSAFADTVCENELPYILGNQSIYASGTYTETFAAQNGCDSVVTLSLVVYPGYKTNLSVTVEKSELPYIFGPLILTKTGTYRTTMSTVFGCDSVLILDLKVEDNTPPTVQCNSIEIALSANGSYTLTEADLAAIAQGSSDDISAFDDLVIEITPSVFTCEHVGETSVTVQVSDAAGNEATCQTTILVLDEVADPTIDEIPDQTMDEDSTLQVLLTGISGGTACDKREVSLTATNNNPGLIDSLNITFTAFDSTATLVIVPSAHQFGTDSITVSVQDSLGNSAGISFLLTVNEVNGPPVIVDEIEDQSMTVEDTTTVFISKLPGVFFEDFDDSSMVFNFIIGDAGLPAWVNIEEEDEQFVLTFTPTEADTGCFEVVVSLQDLAGALGSDTFRVCINPLEVGIFDMDENTFGLNLYPNPTQGHVRIDLENPPYGEIELMVTNIAGSQVFRKTYQSGERIVFDLSNHISGTYLVIVQINEQRIVRKLILDKK